MKGEATVGGGARARGGRQSCGRVVDPGARGSRTRRCGPGSARTSPASSVAIGRARGAEGFGVDAVEGHAAAAAAAAVGVPREAALPQGAHSGAHRPQLRPPRPQSGGAAAPDWAHPAHDRAQPCTRLGSDCDHSGARSGPDLAPIGITVGSAGPIPGPVVRPIGITVGSAAPILGPAVPPIGITVGTAAPTSGSESGPADPNVDPTLGSRHLLCPRHLAWRPFLTLQRNLDLQCPESI